MGVAHRRLDAEVAIHRVFTAARWSIDRVGLALFDWIVREMYLALHLGLAFGLADVFNLAGDLENAVAVGAARCWQFLSHCVKGSHDAEDRRGKLAYFFIRAPRPGRSVRHTRRAGCTRSLAKIQSLLLARSLLCRTLEYGIQSGDKLLASFPVMRVFVLVPKLRLGTHVLGSSASRLGRGESHQVGRQAELVNQKTSIRCAIP